MTRPITSLLVALLGFSTIALFAASRGQRLPPGDSKETIVVGRTTREYILQVPPGLESWNKVPLVLVFHGGGGHASSMPKFSGFDKLAGNPHNLFIAAYPESLNKSWNDSRGLSPADDVAFIRALIAKLEAELPVDPHRIYATGISNGGFFSNRLACELSDQLAAVASVAATMPTTLPPNCHPTRPISILYMNGTNDPLVPVNGGRVGEKLGLKRGDCISLNDAVNFWVRANQTSEQPLSESLPDRVSDGTHIEKDIYPAGKDGTQVVVYRVEGGGHTWPGGSQYLPQLVVGKVSHQIDGTQVIWDFFRSQRLP